MGLRRLGLRRAVGRLWHHFFFRDSTLSPHQASQGPTRRPSSPVIESYKMADPVTSAPKSSQDAPAQPSVQPATENPPSQTLPIRDAKTAKDKGPAQSEKQPPKGKDASAPAAGADAGAAAGEKALTPAELKKKAKAEKAARRAKEKLEREGGAGAAGGSAPGPGQARPPMTPKKDAAGGSAAQKGSRALPQRRGSQSGAAVELKKKKEDKSVAVFGHLYGQQRRTTIAGAGKEVHPAVLALGLQLRDYVVCGSSARCVATMLAFKRVSYHFLVYALYTPSPRSKTDI